MMPIGKWYEIEFDKSEQVIILPMGAAEQQQTGRVLSAGSACSAKAGQRILFQKGTYIETLVDGRKVYMLHEDHLLAILDA